MPLCILTALENGGIDRDRTCDRVGKNHLLYQLSYNPESYLPFENWFSFNKMSKTLNTYMPICPTCKIDKTLTEFSKNKSKKNGRNVVCKSCKKIYQSEWYEQNKILQRSKVNNRRRDLKNWLKNFKSTLHCSECPEDHISCLQFHHTTDNKEVSVADAIKHGWSKDRILGEIEKCVVLCANCHFKHHYNIREISDPTGN